jgi:hypothetical protein
MLNKVIGLFGTCGDSKWREEIAIPILQSMGVEYFNPVVANWTAECAENEVRHATTDRVLMLVITGETTGIASMAESGWQALMASNNGQALVFVLQDMPPSDEEKALRINKTRNLLRQYAKKAGSNLFDDIAEATRFAASLLST